MEFLISSFIKGTCKLNWSNLKGKTGCLGRETWYPDSFLPEKGHTHNIVNMDTTPKLLKYLVEKSTKAVGTIR